MPYDRLPARLRQLIPSERGQEIFRNTVNSQLENGRSESVAFASAWAQLRRAGFERDNATGKWERVSKASGAKPLYMKRKVMNAEHIVEWAKSQGIPTTLDPDDMHVTVIYSKEPFSEEYTQSAEMQGEAPMYYGGHVVRGGKRSVERLGQNGEALVLKIECPKLALDHYTFRVMGASSDWPDYKPHITLSWQADGIDEGDVEPFDGDIVLSDIYVSLLDEDWKSKVTEKRFYGGGQVKGSPTTILMGEATGKWERTEKSRKETLEDKVREHNEKHGDKGRVTLSMLEQVYDRGVGAYRTNPSSVRPNVKSPEQWAMARVNVFLQAIRTGKFPSGKFDTDLLPKEHPLSTRKSQPSASAVHVSSTDWERTRKEDTFRPPASARNNARRVLRWKEKYGDEVKGMTQVGWTRANQLASGENLSRDTVARMSAFARHRKNAEIDPKFKDTPWKDRGYVAWLGWGGTSGVNWANSVMDRLEKRQIDDDSFTTPAEAVVRSMDLGLEGEIHVHDRDGQAVYMPGENHEQYLNQIRRMGGLDQEAVADSEAAKEGLLERAISAIIGAIMQQVPVNKSQEEATVLKVDDEQGLVYGWAYVSTEDGKLLVDTQGDSIEPIEMEKMATNFMIHSRNAKVMHKGETVGLFVHSFPLTNDIMKAFDIYSDREGWLVAMKPDTPEVMAAYKRGDYTGFSIGGKAGDVEEYDAA